MYLPRSLPPRNTYVPDCTSQPSVASGTRSRDVPETPLRASEWSWGLNATSTQWQNQHSERPPPELGLRGSPEPFCTWQLDSRGRTPRFEKHLSYVMSLEKRVSGSSDLLNCTWVWPILVHVKDPKRPSEFSKLILLQLPALPAPFLQPEVPLMSPKILLFRRAERGRTETASGPGGKALGKGPRLGRIRGKPKTRKKAREGGARFRF